MKRVTVVLCLLIVCLIGLVILQVFLSRQKNSRLGLILPGVSFLFSLVGVFNVVDTGSVLQNIMTLLMVLVLSNIGTLVLLLIYWVCRAGSGKKQEMDRRTMFKIMVIATFIQFLIYLFSFNLR